MSEEKTVQSKSPGQDDNSSSQKNCGWIRVPPKSHPKPKDVKAVSGIEQLSDVIFDCEDGKQTSSFELMLDKLATYIGGKFEHGGELLISIKTLAPVVMPTPDPYANSATDVEKEIWKLDLVAWVKKRNKIADNLKRCYAIIWGQCTEFMKAKLQASANFAVMENTQCSIDLLKEIKGLVYKFDGQRYHPQALVDACDRFHRFFQGREMTNPQYLARFKSLVSVIEQYDGTVGVHKGMMKAELEKATGGKPYDSTPGTYTTLQLAAAEAHAQDKFLAVKFITGADKFRYGDLQTDLKNDFSKGVTSYPDSLTAAYTRLTTWTPKYDGPRGVPNAHGTSFAQHAGGVSCWGCGKEGVVLGKCTEPSCVEKWKNKNAKKEVTGQQHLNIDQALLDDWIEQQNAGIEEYLGYAFHQDDTRRLPRDCILLDNQSTHHTFYNGELLDNIRATDDQITIKTNGGKLVYTLEGDFPGFGTVWYNPEGIANILSMSCVEEDGHEVRYNNGVFTVTNNETLDVMAFSKLPNGLYAHRVQTTGMTLVQTVSENEQFYTPRQISRAKAARELYEMIGRPSLHDYLGVVNNRLLPNIKVTAKDIMAPEEIFGKDLGSIKGKTTRDKPSLVVTD